MDDQDLAILGGRHPPKKRSKRWNDLTDDEKQLELQTPEKQLIDMNKLVTWCPELWPHVRWTTEREAFAANDGQQGTVEDVPDEHIKKLLEAGLWEEVDETEASGWCAYRLKPEPEKRKMRVLGWPKAWNKMMQEREPGAIPDTLDSTKYQPDTWVVEFDIQSAFFRVPLARKVSRCFCTKVERDGRIRVFAWTVMLMGFTRSPNTMHKIQEAIGKLSIRRIEDPIGNRYALITSFPYIDNIRFQGADKAAIARVRVSYMELCEKLNVPLNESEGVTQTSTFLGIEHDYKKSERRIGAKTIRKLENLSNPRDESLEEWRKKMGLLIWGSRILRMNMTEVYYAIKYYCRLARENHSTATVKRTTPNSIRTIIQKWITTLTSNKFVPNQEDMEPDSVRAYIITDASLTGYGALLFIDGQLYAWHASEWTTPSANIAPLELRTVGIAIRRFHKILNARRINAAILTDSMDAFTSLLKGRTGGSNAMNGNLTFVHQMLRLAPTVMFAGWIPTYQNPADGPSRGTEPKQAELTRDLKETVLHQIWRPT